MEDTLCAVKNDLTDIDIQIARQSVGCERFHHRNWDGKSYCIIHYPGIDKINDYEYRKAIETIANDEYPSFNYGILPNFRYPQYLKIQEADFIECKFVNDAFFEGLNINGPLSFKNSVFEGAANFSSANLKHVSFYKTIFEGAVRFDNTTFRSVGIDFEQTQFKSYASFRDIDSKGELNFTRAVFESRPDFLGADFEMAQFAGATFKSGASFNSTKFTSQLSFMGAHFYDETRFSGSEFNGNVFFNHSTFYPRSRVHFDYINPFKTMSFRNAELEGFIRIHGGNGGEKMRKGLVEKIPYTLLFEKESSKLEFDEVRISPSARLSFNTVRLEPNWFLGVDPKDFIFSNIRWSEHEKEDLSPEFQLKKLSHLENNHASEALARICRRIASNHEEYAHFERASYFRKFAFEIEKVYKKNERYKWKQDRQRLWKIGISCFSIKESIAAVRNIINHETKRPIDILTTLYGLLSKFGESWKRAFFCLFIIYACGAIAFTSLGYITEGFPLSFPESLAYTFKTMLFQKPEPKPTGWASLVEILLLIFGPIQAALLTLAIRRKFLKS